MSDVGANFRLLQLSVLLLVTALTPSCNDSVPPPPRDGNSVRESFRLCYERKAPSVEESVELLITPQPSDDAAVQGELRGFVSNPGAGYVAEYRCTLQGTLSGDSFELSVTTITGGTERTNTETWQRIGDELIAGAFRFALVHCPAP